MVPIFEFVIMLTTLFRLHFAFLFIGLKINLKDYNGVNGYRSKRLGYWKVLKLIYFKLCGYMYAYICIYCSCFFLNDIFYPLVHFGKFYLGKQLKHSQNV